MEHQVNAHVRETRRARVTRAAVDAPFQRIRRARLPRTRRIRAARLLGIARHVGAKIVSEVHVRRHEQRLPRRA